MGMLRRRLHRAAKFAAGESFLPQRASWPYRSPRGSFQTFIGSCFSISATESSLPLRNVVRATFCVKDYFGRQTGGAELSREALLGICHRDECAGSASTTGALASLRRSIQRPGAFCRLLWTRRAIASGRKGLSPLSRQGEQRTTSLRQVLESGDRQAESI
jgi:hypothetical protein